MLRRRLFDSRRWLRRDLTGLRAGWRFRSAELIALAHLGSRSVGLSRPIALSDLGLRSARLPHPMAHARLGSRPVRLPRLRRWIRQNLGVSKELAHLRHGAALLPDLEARVDIRCQRRVRVPRELLRLHEGHPGPGQVRDEGHPQRVEVDLLPRPGDDPRSPQVVLEGPQRRDRRQRRIVRPAIAPAPGLRKELRVLLPSLPGGRRRGDQRQLGGPPVLRRVLGQRHQPELEVHVPPAHLRELRPPQPRRRRHPIDQRPMPRRPLQQRLELLPGQGPPLQLRPPLPPDLDDLHRVPRPPLLAHQPDEEAVQGDPILVESRVLHSPLEPDLVQPAPDPRRRDLRQRLDPCQHPLELRPPDLPIPLVRPPRLQHAQELVDQRLDLGDPRLEVRLEARVPQLPRLEQLRLLDLRGRLRRDPEREPLPLAVDGDVDPPELAALEDGHGASLWCGGLIFGGGLGVWPRFGRVCPGLSRIERGGHARLYPGQRLAAGHQRFTRSLACGLNSVEGLCWTAVASTLTTTVADILVRLTRRAKPAGRRSAATDRRMAAAARNIGCCAAWTQ